MLGLNFASNSLGTLATELPTFSTTRSKAATDAQMSRPIFDLFISSVGNFGAVRRYFRRRVCHRIASFFDNRTRNHSVPRASPPEGR